MSNLFDILKRAVAKRGAKDIIVLLAVACGDAVLERKLRAVVEEAPPPMPIDRWRLAERSARIV